MTILEEREERIYMNANFKILIKSMKGAFLPIITKDEILLRIRKNRFNVEFTPQSEDKVNMRQDFLMFSRDFYNAKEEAKEVFEIECE